MGITSSRGSNSLTTEMKSGELMTSQSPSLPHELTVEILSWLPIKHLSPFRCVSKTWFQLITRDSQFAELHFDRSIQMKSTPNIVVKKMHMLQRYYLATDYTACDNSIQLELPFQQDSNCYVVCGICNGMLCLSSIYEDEVYIWNPITNDHITIPCPLTPSRFPGFEKGTQFAFGFHQGTSEYKVVKICGEYQSKTPHCHSQVSVYTLGIDSSWRTVGDDIQYNMVRGSIDRPLVNGSIHLLCIRNGSFSLSAIVAFDLIYESFEEIPPPKDVNFDDSFSYNRIGELGGQLCMFCGHYGQDVQIWVMKQYGVANSWSKLFTIGRPELGEFFTFIEPLCVVSHNGDIILKKNMTGLILYHSKTNSVSYPTKFGCEIYDAHAFIGSIISPRVISSVSHTMT